MTFWGCATEAVCMNRIVAEFFNSTSLSSCKVKFQQFFTSVGQWSLVQICSCPSCGPWETVLPHRALEGGCSPSQHLAWTSDKRVAASVFVCSFTDTQNTVTLPGFFTVCYNRLVLRINNESSALSTLHYHIANLSSISEDFHCFSTECVLCLLNWSSVSHWVSSVPF